MRTWASEVLVLALHKQRHFVMCVVVVVIVMAKAQGTMHKNA